MRPANPAPPGAAASCTVASSSTGAPLSAAGSRASPAGASSSAIPAWHSRSVDAAPHCAPVLRQILLPLLQALLTHGRCRTRPGDGLIGARDCRHGDRVRRGFRCGRQHLTASPRGHRDSLRRTGHRRGTLAAPEASDRRHHCQAPLPAARASFAQASTSRRTDSSRKLRQPRRFCFHCRRRNKRRRAPLCARLVHCGRRRGSCAASVCPTTQSKTSTS